MNTDTDPKRDDDLIGQLIQQAGRREQPPQADYERVLAASTAVLENKLRQRRRKQTSIWLSAGVAAAAIVGAVLLNFVQQPALEVARIDRALGTIETRSDEASPWSGIADENQALIAGTSLRTRAGSRLGVQLASGISVRLDESTEITLADDDRLVLLTGKVYVDSGKLPSNDRRIAVETVAGTATDVGTQFEVRYASEALRLRVREGRVDLQRDSDELSSVAGDELFIDPTGAVRRARIAVDDPDWGWAETVAPAPNIEERPVSALLDWVSRETGREVRFAQPILELKAETTILHGSIRNLAPLNALDVMLATTDLEYSLLEDGTILVSAKTKIY